MRHVVPDGKGEAVAREILWLAWKACGGPIGMGILQDRPRATKDDVWQGMQAANDYHGSANKRPDTGEVAADYMFGRMMKLYFWFDENSVVFKEEGVDPDYNGWAGKYPTVGLLVQAAIDSVDNPKTEASPTAAQSVEEVVNPSVAHIRKSGMPEEKTLAEQVVAVMEDSLFREEEIIDGEPPKGAILVEGIVRSFGFHPQRLESHRNEIKKILNQMPDPFHKGKGGGWSFLNLCMTKDGEQWAEHPTMEELVALAIGLGMATYCLPKKAWSVFPGGMPYVTFDVDGKKRTL